MASWLLDPGLAEACAAGKKSALMECDATTSSPSLGSHGGGAGSEKDPSEVSPVVSLDRHHHPSVQILALV